MAFPTHSFMFQPHQEDHHPLHQDHSHHQQHLIHGSGPHAPPPFMMMKRSMSFSGIDDSHHPPHHHHHHHHHSLCGGGGEEEGVSEEEDGSQGEKKKRLNVEQVKMLEKSFELGNKLEPERKMQLAKALGLQPRQVAIWFQNRRARWKTKQLEKDYDVLKKQFDVLKADNDSLHAQNKKLHSQLSALKGCSSTREISIEGDRENQKREGEGSWSNNGSENSGSDVNNLDHHNNNNNTVSRTAPLLNTSSSASSHHKGIILEGKTLFPSSALRPTSITQLLVQGSSRSSDFNPDHHIQMVQTSSDQESSFCNMFVNGAGVNTVVEQDHQQGFLAVAGATLFSLRGQQ